MLFPIRRTGFLALVLLGSMTLPVAASQSTGFRWWTSEQFKKELGLSSEQSGRIDRIYQDTLPELRQEWQELERLETKLSRLFESNADEAVLARQIDRVETARANLNKSRALMLMRMRRVLTAEQLVRFKTLAERYEGEVGTSSPSRSPGPASGRR
jgi:Spy/CpxP family protein refolding chaperone